MSMAKRLNQLRTITGVIKECPTCRKQYENKFDKESIDELGECGMCEHLRGDYQHEDRIDEHEYYHENR